MAQIWQLKIIWLRNYRLYVRNHAFISVTNQEVNEDEGQRDPNRATTTAVRSLVEPRSFSVVPDRCDNVPKTQGRILSILYRVRPTHTRERTHGIQSGGKGRFTRFFLYPLHVFVMLPVSEFTHASSACLSIACSTQIALYVVLSPSRHIKSIFV